MTLPSNWIRSTIGEVTTYVQRGKGPKYSEKNAFPVINQKAIRWNGIQEEHLKYVREDTWEKYTEERYIRAGDILWNSTGTGTIGRACLLDEAEAAKAKVVDSHVTIVRSNTTKVIPSYLFYWIKSPRIQFEIASLYTGTTNQVELSKSKVLDTEIPLAPLAEQSRIVEKLDSIFEKLEMAQSRLDKVPQLLKRFRMSVLSAAVAGELTEEWRDANNAGDWSEIKVTNIVEKIEAGKNLKCHERPPREDELGIVKISSVTWGIYDEEESKTLPDSSLFLENRRINVGDFLISRANTLELLGMPVIVHQVTKNLMLSDKVWRIVAEDADKQWLSIFLRSPEGRKKIESRATGNQESMRNIAQKAFLDIDLPMPSPEEKEAIISIVNGLFSNADLVEKQYLVAKQRVDKLTQSILARAFRGELFEPFSDKAGSVVQPQSSVTIDEQPTVAEETALEQLDKSPVQTQPTPKAVDDKSELLSQLKSAQKAMTAQQLFDSASVETFKAIDELFVELKRLLELELIEKVGEGESCQFKAAKP